MKARFVIALMVGLFAAACSKSDDKAAGAKAADSKGAPAAQTGPLEMTAEDFHKDYSAASGPQALSKYGSRRIKLTGTVIRSMGFPSSHQVWLKGGAGRVTLKFEGSHIDVAKEKGKAGATFAAECAVQGMMGSNIEMGECVPK